MSAPADTVLRLYNTLTRQLEPFVPGDPARVTFYTCGPTVYDDAHIGNFRSFLAADLLRRWIESPLCTLQGDDGKAHAGPREVVHVMNITDVGHMTDDSAADGGGEDKMALAGQRLAEAKKAGTVHADADINPNDPSAIASFYADRFVEDAKALGLKVATDADADPRLMPRASAFVDKKHVGMIPMIESLIESGHAYISGDAGSRAVYFDVQSYPTYGQLSGNTLDQLRGGAGGRVSDSNQSQKKHPADFLLWKEDESHLMKWPSPWGTGYPGWHIECSAMARAILGDIIDLHSGGEDNIFPHHECERAQSCCATGHDTFARHWFHGRFLMVEGKKMSKSAGTFYTARQLFEQGHDPAAVRLSLIGSHYRSNLDFSAEGLEAASKRIRRWRRAFQTYSLASTEAPQGVDVTFAVSTETILEEFAHALQDDLNISAAVAAIDQLASHAFNYPGLNEDSFLAWLGYREEVQMPQAPATDNEVRLMLESKDHLIRRIGAFHLFDAIVGVIFRPMPKSTAFEIGVFLPGVDPSPEVEALLVERADAKKAKDYARSDAIRDELAGKGYAIKDVAGGKVEVGPA